MGETQNKWKKEIEDMSDSTLAKTLANKLSGTYREMLIDEALARIVMRLK